MWIFLIFFIETYVLGIHLNCIDRLFGDIYAFFFWFSLLKTYVVGTHLNCIKIASAIQIGTHNICIYKEVDKKYALCNLKTTNLLDWALIGVCVVIR